MKNMKDKIVFTDRYGGNYPDTNTMCKGDCEGFGWVPVQKNDEDKLYAQKWLDAENIKPASDGWHFVICNDCNGTGKK